MRRLDVPLLLVLFALPAGAQQPQSVRLPERDRALAGAPAPVLSFGREEGESWELLSNVSGVDFDDRDNLYILDAGNHRVVVIDRTGRLVRSMGKRGGGPGELIVPSALAVLRDGTVAVADLGRGAFSLFAPDGTFRFNVPFADSLGHPGPEQRGAGTSLLAHPDGLAVLGALRISVGGPGGGAPPAPPTDVPVYVRPAAERAAPRLLYRIPREPPVIRTSGDASNRSVRSVPRAFAPQPAWAVLPTGAVVVVHGNSPEYRLHILDAAGTPVAVVTRPLEPRRVSRNDQERARAQAAERMRSGTGMIRMEVRAGPGGVDRSVSTGGGGNGPSEQEIQAQLRELQFAAVIPVVSGVRADPLGRIWVARAPEVVGEDGPIDLLAANGRYIGTLTPQPLPDAVSRSGLAAYITRDDLGVERVLVKRLPGNWK